jgi:hypothetical protein
LEAVCYTLLVDESGVSRNNAQKCFVKEKRKKKNNEGKIKMIWMR